MSYKIILTSGAFRNLEKIKAFISQDNSIVAKQYISKIFAKFDYISIFPYIGKPINNSIFSFAKCLYSILTEMKNVCYASITLSFIP